MKRIKKIILILIVCVFATPTVSFGAVFENLKESYKSWGAPSMLTCFTQDFSNGCVGDSLKDGSGKCLNWTSPDTLTNSGTSHDEGATLVMLARKIVENGAYFCVTQLQGANKDKGNAWTVYYEPAGGTTECVWLCKDGYSGDGCTETSDSSCDSTEILRSSFSNYKIEKSSSVNIENTIPRFLKGIYKGCGVHKGQEHDMILTITDWTKSGHGAFATPVIFRAERSGWKQMRSTVTLRKTSVEPTLLCKHGYQPNSDATDCSEVDSTLCAMNDMCDGWSSSQFDRTSHVLKAINGCYQYRCLPGTAFESELSKTCVVCTGDARVGIPYDTGTCVKCAKGEVFDEDNAADNYCSTAEKLSVQDLVYGKGKTQTTPWKDQCWLIVEPEEYRKCLGL